jgi:hypothetical protein
MVGLMPLEAPLYWLESPYYAKIGEPLSEETGVPMAKTETEDRAMMAMPASAAAMREHLMADHGMSDAAAADMSMSDMQSKHDSMHSDGADHTHSGRSKRSEKRFAIDAWQTGDWQIRAEDDGMTFTGYAAVFNSDSDGPIPGFGIEQIAPGAFSKSLKSKRDIKMFLNHNSDLVLASREGGTLDLAEDDTGLLATARFIDTTVGLDTAKNVKAGNVRHMSFGFNPQRTKARTDGIAGTIHTETQLWEVSPVTAWPAYKGTSAFVRHLAELTDGEPGPLSEALELLVDPAGKLTPEQRDLLLHTINARTDVPLVGPLLSRWLSRQSELPV